MKQPTRRSRSHFRHNVVADLALFFALGGTAIAAKPLITGEDVKDDSLTGADIVESSLGQVPSALLGGLGRSASTTVDCSPRADAFETCLSVGPIELAAPTRVLLVGSMAMEPESDPPIPGAERCRLGTSATGGLEPTETVVADGESATLTAVTDPLGPGPVSFGIDCKSSIVGSAAQRNVMLSAVAMSAG